MNARAPAVRVIIVEDNWVWASAFERQIEGADGLSWAGTATGVEEGLELIAAARPDLALIDLLLDDDSGLRLARIARSRHPAVKIVMVSSEPSSWAVEQARALGLEGFLGKDDIMDPKLALAAIRSVAKGGRSFTPRAEFAGGADPGVIAARPYGLTTRQLELVACLRDGLRTGEIMRRMCISRQTLNNSTTAIGRKLGVSGRLEIVARCLREGILPPRRRM